MKKNFNYPKKEKEKEKAKKKIVPNEKMKMRKVKMLR